MRDPSARFAGRLPWLLLGIGGLVILAVIGAMLAARREGDVNVNVRAAATSTAALAPTTVVVGVPVTVVITAAAPPPTAVLVTAIPTLTVREPGSQAGAQNLPAPAPPVVAQPTPAPPPTQVSQPTPAPALTRTPAPTTPTPRPTDPPFSGEVSPAGGLGNTRQSLDAAFGAPTGETPNRLVVYKSASTEYQVRFDGQPPRAIIVARSDPSKAPLTLEMAQGEVRRLVPTDAERRTPQPEGNPQFLVERYRSATLARALPAATFSQWGGETGDLIVVYARSTTGDGRIERIIVAIGDNPDSVRQRAQP